MACQHAVKIEEVYHQTCILQAALYGLFSQAEGEQAPVANPDSHTDDLFAMWELSLQMAMTLRKLYRGDDDPREEAA